MELLAEMARMLGLNANGDFPSLRAIYVTGELLGERRREHIERQWGVPVFNIYGSTETANIASICEHSLMHVVEQDFVIEVLSEDGFGLAVSGERGIAAITTLSHQASALLRYLNEDVISVEHGLCTCGRTGSKLVHYKRETGDPKASSAILLRDLLKFKFCKYEKSRELFEEVV